MFYDVYRELYQNISDIDNPNNQNNPKVRACQGTVRGFELDSLYKESTYGTRVDYIFTSFPVLVNLSPDGPYASNTDDSRIKSDPSLLQSDHAQNCLKRRVLGQAHEQPQSQQPRPCEHPCEGSESHDVMEIWQDLGSDISGGMVKGVKENQGSFGAKQGMNRDGDHDGRHSRHGRHGRHGQGGKHSYSDHAPLMARLHLPCHSCIVEQQTLSMDQQQSIPDLPFLHPMIQPVSGRDIDTRPVGFGQEITPPLHHHHPLYHRSPLTPQPLEPHSDPSAHSPNNPYLPHEPHGFHIKRLKLEHTGAGAVRHSEPVRGARLVRDRRIKMRGKKDRKRDFHDIESKVFINLVHSDDENNPSNPSSPDRSFQTSVLCDVTNSASRWYHRGQSRRPLHHPRRTPTHTNHNPSAALQTVSLPRDPLPQPVTEISATVKAPHIHTHPLKRQNHYIGNNRIANRIGNPKAPRYSSEDHRFDPGTSHGCEGNQISDLEARSTSSRTVIDLTGTDDTGCSPLKLLKRPLRTLYNAGVNVLKAPMSRSTEPTTHTGVTSRSHGIIVID